MVRRSKDAVVYYYNGKKVKLCVPVDEFFATVLLFFGQPGTDFRIGPYVGRVQRFENFKRLLSDTESGMRFTHCVTQCGGLKSQRWELYHMYLDWHKEALNRVRRVTGCPDCGSPDPENIHTASCKRRE